jgi:hypothetical protein
MKNIIKHLSIVFVILFHSCETKTESSDEKSKPPLSKNDISVTDIHLHDHLKLARETWDLMVELETMREEGWISFAKVDPNEIAKRDELIKNIIIRLNTFKDNIEDIVEQQKKISGANMISIGTWQPESVPGEDSLMELRHNNPKLPALLGSYANTFRYSLRVLNVFHTNKNPNEIQAAYIITYGELHIMIINDILEYYTDLQVRLIKLDDERKALRR